MSSTPVYTYPTSKEIKALAPHVLRKKQKNIKQLQKAAIDWQKASWLNKMDYEISWLGLPIIQNPYDMALMQELIFTLKPDVIVETGIAHGGSLVFYSSLLELLGKGIIVGVELELREHNRRLLTKHPMMKRIRIVEGSSIDPVVIKKVQTYIKPKDVVLVLLDSNHRKDHVLRELELYQHMVTRGSYIIVFDTFLPLLEEADDRKEFKQNSPLEAVTEFLSHHHNFRRDATMNKFFISSFTDGALKKNT